MKSEAEILARTSHHSSSSVVTIHPDPVVACVECLCVYVSVTQTVAWYSVSPYRVYRESTEYTYKARPELLLGGGRQPERRLAQHTDSELCVTLSTYFYLQQRQHSTTLGNLLLASNGGSQR